MSVLAHLSDLHLLERDHHERRGWPLRRLQFLSVGAALDAEARLKQAVELLREARRRGAEHVVLTGDLTEDGASGQFEMLAEALWQSGLPSERVTLVPGNHDGYSEGAAAWARALEGPLRAYQPTSSPDALTVLPNAVIVPVSTMLGEQWFTRSRGIIREEDVSRVRRLASDTISRGRAVVVAQHHPPSRHPLFPIEWFDGVENATTMRDLLLERTRVHVLHGHTHRHTTKHFSGRAHAQVFSTASVRDQYATGQALRFYLAEDGYLHDLSNLAVAQQPVFAQTYTPTEDFILSAVPA